MKLSFNNSKVKSKFIIEEYFAIIVQFEEEPLNNKYYRFSNNDQDLLEISINSNTNSIKRIVLTLCNHFLFNDSILDVPPYTEGTLLIEEDSQKEANDFLLELFTNCAKIILSKDEPSYFFKMGNIIFGFDSKSNIVQLLILINDEERKHIQFELENA